MARFPEVDIAGSADIASSIAVLDSFAIMHDTAERASQLYKVGHAIIEAAISPYVNDDRVEAAILSGVSSYEIFGSMIQGDETLQQYRRGDLVAVFQGSEGIMDTLSVFDDAYEEMADVPELRDAIRLLAPSSVTHGSTELIERSVQGAAVLRKMQRELDSLLAFRGELDLMIGDGNSQFDARNLSRD